jgi:hypothetical protein
MTPRFINSTHVVDLSGSLEIDREGNFERVLTVVTDLPLQETDPNYDKDELHKLVAAVQAGLGDMFDRAILKRGAKEA